YFPTRVAMIPGKSPGCDTSPLRPAAPWRGSWMDWAELIVNLIGIVLEAGLWYSVDRSSAAQRRGSGNLRKAEPDDWRCPDASEIARVVSGSVAQARDRRAEAPFGPPTGSQDPLWDRDLDG